VLATKTIDLPNNLIRVELWYMKGRDVVNELLTVKRWDEQAPTLNASTNDENAIFIASGDL